MSTYETSDQERIDVRDQRAHWEAFEAVVASEGIVNVCNHSKDDPSAHSVFVDTLDEEAVACSCKDWEYRKPAGGCKHIRFVNTTEPLLLAATTEQGDRADREASRAGRAGRAGRADRADRADRAGTDGRSDTGTETETEARR